MSKLTTLVIEFDSVELRDDFRGWLSDGGGEYNYMEGHDEAREFLIHFDYSGDTVKVTKTKRNA